jgi:hypothetical protein
VLTEDILENISRERIASRPGMGGFKILRSGLAFTTRTE